MSKVKTGYNLAGTMYHEYEYINDNGVRVVIVTWPTQTAEGYKVAVYPFYRPVWFNTLAESLDHADNLTG